MKIDIEAFVRSFSLIFEDVTNFQPWEITNNLSVIILKKIEELDSNFIVNEGIAVHRTAIVEEKAILKAPVIISKNCFVGANAYLRGGVYLGENTSVGPSCEVKTSIIFNNTEIAHLNFIGDCIIGSNVNFEAGSITANYFNERKNKTIFVLHNSEAIETSVQKLGSLVGDNCKIGANAVLSPGTVLNRDAIVKRLELVEQHINLKKTFYE